jgi:hypothetical protein
MNIETDTYCFRCGDKIEGPFVAWGGFVRGKPYILAFHFDCHFATSMQFVKQYMATKDMVESEMKKPKG